MRVRSWMLATAAAAALSAGSWAAADVTGMCKLDGKAPEAKAIDMSGVKECNDMHPDPVYTEDIMAGDKGELKNVIVSIKKEDSPDLTGDIPKTPAVLDQKGCTYSPHVLPMMIGQDFLVKNSDGFLHNIHTLSTINPSFNKAQGTKNDGEKVETAKAIEYYHVKCDVHPWMSSYVAVFDNPFFATSGDDGKFAIKGLPDGDYTLVAWHEKLPKQEAKVTVKDGKATADIVFTFKAEGAAAPDVQNIIFASDSGVKTPAACCDAMSKPAEAAAK